MIEYKWKTLKEATPTQVRVVFAVRAYSPAPLFGDEGNMEYYTKYETGINENGKYYILSKMNNLTEKEYYTFDWCDDPRYMIDMSQVLAWFPAPFMTREEENYYWDEYEKNRK